jgi:succinate dehydrogenase / fumarate reductase, iron-sulfur subunit
MKDIPGDTSFLEMLDILNEQIINDGGSPGRSGVRLLVTVY